ncbi:MAG: GNAT family N-acetyltransferase [Ktedonobacteraceae bacterium]
MSKEHREELTIREVTRENWREALRLAVHPDQQRFVAAVVPIAAIALAKAYIRPRGLLWLPYAFYANTQMIGFIELAYEQDSSENYWIFHFFIDITYQGQGYGKKALLLFLDFLKQQHPHCHAVYLAVHPENVRAQRLYTSVGCQPTGDDMEGEPIYQLVVSRDERTLLT